MAYTDLLIPLHACLELNINHEDQVSDPHPDHHERNV